MEDTTPSQIIFGDVNEEHFVAEKLHYFQLVTTDYWGVDLEEVRVGDVALDFCGGFYKKKCHAILDSGTLNIAMAE